MPFFKSGLVVATLSMGVLAQNSTGPLQFQVASGGNTNYFLRDNVTAAQILVPATSNNGTNPGTPQRLVVALPAGNSGALVYFLPGGGNSTASNGTSGSLSLQVVNGSLTSTQSDFNNTGVKGTLRFDSDATMGVAVIGAVRAMRDYVEGSGLTHEIFNYTLGAHNSSYLQLHRNNINTSITSDFIMQAVADPSGSGTSPSMMFDITPGNNGTFTPPTVQFMLQNGSAQGFASFSFVTNETTLPPLSSGSLFLDTPPSGSSKALAQKLAGLADGKDLQGQQISFLTYANKFTAGGWRFLTYFGRDTLIAARLLSPLMTSEAIEAVLSGVLERANSTGALCHEETIGDYASFVNIGNNMSSRGAEPFYDYKMIDTDLFLLPLMNHYLLELPQGKGRGPQFLAKMATLQNGSYSDLLTRNINYNLGRAAPFAADPTNYTNLLSLRPGQPVGQWRDSNQGLGYGQYPYDVNAALVPATLRAIENLSKQGIIDKSLSKNASKMADVWEAHAHNFFSVTLNNTVANTRLDNFITTANLSVQLTEGAQNFTNTSFYALSLKADGTPVEVLHSDIGETMLFANDLTAPVLDRVVKALQPYPKGLLTPLGMLITNPAYDVNTTNIEVLDRTAYHGTVVWSWQQGMMAAGLERQLSFCNSSIVTVDTHTPPATKPTWCSDSKLVASLMDARTRLWQAIDGDVADRFSEVWSYSYDNSTNKFTTADLATLSPVGTESDAIQLWSYGFLALQDPTQNTSNSE